MTGSTDPARILTPVVRLAPAKLNLTLAVGEWLALLEAFGDIGHDRRGRRADETAP